VKKICWNENLSLKQKKRKLIWTENNDTAVSIKIRSLLQWRHQINAGNSCIITADCWLLPTIIKGRFHKAISALRLKFAFCTHLFFPDKPSCTCVLRPTYCIFYQIWVRFTSCTQLLWSPPQVSLSQPSLWLANFCFTTAAKPGAKFAIFLTLHFQWKALLENGILLW
jgi:hypothetical protein